MGPGLKTGEGIMIPKVQQTEERSTVLGASSPNYCLMFTNLYISEKSSLWKVFHLIFLHIRGYLIEIHDPPSQNMGVETHNPRMTPMLEIKFTSRVQLTCPENAVAVSMLEWGFFVHCSTEFRTVDSEAFV